MLYVYGVPMVDQWKTMYAFSIDRDNPQYKGPFNSVLNVCVRPLHVSRRLTAISLSWARAVGAPDDGRLDRETETLQREPVLSCTAVHSQPVLHEMNGGLSSRFDWRARDEEALPIQRAVEAIARGIRARGPRVRRDTARACRE